MSDPETEHLEQDVDARIPDAERVSHVGNAAIDDGMATAMGAGAAAGGEPVRDEDEDDDLEGDDDE